MTIAAPTLDDAIALAERMAQNPADAVTLAGQLAELVQSLPPGRSELLSRPAFERASLWSLATSFENIALGAEVGPQIIRCQRDVWIRGVQIQAYVQPLADLVADYLAKLRVLERTCRTTGDNWRGAIEANWRLDAKQGFISTGQAEILGRGTLVAGDGFWNAPLDWRLQKDQVIEVRVRNVLDRLIPVGASDVLVAADYTIRWCVVSFWAEELNQPSAR
jgi:hypothetical protein